MSPISLTQKVASLVLLVVVLFCCSQSLQAQSGVLNIFPQPNTVSATVADTVKITFRSLIDTSTATPSTVALWGDIGGYYSTSLHVNQNILQIVPLRPFINGERVWVNVGDALYDRAGNSLGGFSFQFTVRNELGSGIFALKDSITFSLQNGKDPVNLTVVDINNDLLLDVITANFSSGSITVFQQFPIGKLKRFPSQYEFQAGRGSVHIVAGDLENDNKIDLAVANFLDNTVTLFYNYSSRTEPVLVPKTIQVGEKPIKVRLQDIDLDGDLDLLVLCFGKDALQFYLNTGFGQFTPLSFELQTPKAPTDFIIGEWNADGLPDLAIASAGENQVRLWIGRGYPNFYPYRTINLSITPNQLLEQDILSKFVNNVTDGEPELLVLSQAHNMIQIYQHSPDSLWAELAQVITDISRPGNMALGNIDDKDRYLKFAQDYDLDLIIPAFDGSRVHILRNKDGQEIESIEEGTPLFSYSPTSVVTADLDRDGDQDLVIAEPMKNQIRVWWQKGGRKECCALRPGQLAFGNIFNFDSVMVLSSKTLGLEILNISDLSDTLVFELQGESMYSIPEQMVILPPHSSYTLPITFSPSDTGQHNTPLVIFGTNGVQISQINVFLSGIGIRPILAAATDTLNFQSVPPGKVKQLNMIVSNVGNTTADVSIKEIHPGSPFSYVGPTTFQINYAKSQYLTFLFSPDSLGYFLTRVTLASNDPVVPELTFYLKGKGSIAGPKITSADTIFATEDFPVHYITQAYDPDGDTLTIEYQHLPSWLAPRDDDPWTLEGTPREGDLDTYFDIIVSDGFLIDSLRVIIDVTPVNDPPLLFINPNRTSLRIQEKESLRFTLLGRDPEDSTLVISAAQLPEGARLYPAGRNRAEFQWMPDFGQVGSYTITFIARELYEDPPLQANLKVNISVEKRLPDLIAVDFTADSLYTYKGRPLPLRVTIGNQSAPVDQSFAAAILYREVTIADTLILGMALDESLTWNPIVQFEEIGRQTVKLVVDRDQAITESIESNNSLTLTIDVRQGQLHVSPNPFTPNSDGYNDRVAFDFQEFSVTTPNVKIWNFQGQQVRLLNQPQGTKLYWDGLDEEGKVLPPGIYLFQFLDGDIPLVQGNVVLAR